ncbi:unnamed protein product, partial [Sphacelaria rigidula]
IFPLSLSRHVVAWQSIEGFSTAIMVVIAVCFLPASYAIFVVKERAVKAKHQQAGRFDS